MAVAHRPTRFSHHFARADRFRPRWEGEIVLVTLGCRVRFYAGTSNFPRSRVHSWRAYGSRGIVVRRSSAFPGRGGCRVFGVQWRRA